MSKIRDTSSANKAFYLITLVASIFLLLTLTLLSKTLPLTVNHAIYFCQQAINGLMVSLPHSTPSMFVLILLTILGIGAGTLLISYYSSRVFINRLLKHKIKLPNKINQIAQEIGLKDRVDIVEFPGHISLCYGLLNPRVCLSRNLINKLSTRELKAVLLHESYHLNNKDPLKILLSNVMTSTFFFIPIFKDINRFFSFSKEMAADRLVINTLGKKDLKLALVKLLSTNPMSTGFAYFNNTTNLEKRIAYITGDGKKMRSKLPWGSIFTSLSMLIIVGLFINLPVYAIENGDTHDYYLCTDKEKCMMSCTQESSTKEILFSTQEPFSSLNYSPNLLIDN